MPPDMWTHVNTLKETVICEEAPWSRSWQAWRFVFARYLPFLAAGNVIWETLQLPFYTLWREGNPRGQLFAILHSTAGDVMIGVTSLLTAAILLGGRRWPRSGRGGILSLATFFGVGYTVFSEWMNTQVTMGWQYAEPMLRVPPFGTGIAPLLQWIVIPPIAYTLARASIAH